MKFCKESGERLTREMNAFKKCEMDNNLIEKTFFAYNEAIHIQKEESETASSSPTNRQNKNKKNHPKWFTAVGAAFVLGMAVLVGGCAGGDGKEQVSSQKQNVQDEEKAEETNKDNKDNDEKIIDLPSSSEKIIAPFPIGTTVSELKAHYGEPTFDDFWDGARVVFFDDEGYIIDWDEKVYGYWFVSPKLSVFGATVGMTAKEINKIFGENVEPSLNELSGLDEYSFGYHKNDYKIIFYSEEKYGPTTDVKVIWEYWNQ